jgi:hypothetical protein
MDDASMVAPSAREKCAPFRYASSAMLSEDDARTVTLA